MPRRAENRVWAKKTHGSTASALSTKQTMLLSRVHSFEAQPIGIGSRALCRHAIVPRTLENEADARLT